MPEKRENFHYISYRDIPNVTEEEINAVNALLRQNRSFIYGASPSTECFFNENGKISGFTVLLCDWLTGLFGAPFVPKFYEWNELVTGLETGEIDFTGELTPTDERRKIYFMTDPIAMRSVKYMRLAESLPFDLIRTLRQPRYAFLSDAMTIHDVSALIEYSFETTLVNDYTEVYALLKSGGIDAFFDDGPAEAAFDIYSDVIAEDFFPLIYAPVSLTTLNKNNIPIIQIVQKALQHGGIQFLTELYNTGNNEYQKHKLFLRFSADEKEYIRNNRSVKFAAEYDNYPLSFYNTYTKKYEGIAFDILTEIENLTGLVFENVNDKKYEFTELLEMLEDGRASFISELIRSPEREGRFLWPDTPVLNDQYALLSRSDYRTIKFNEILYMRIGLGEGYAHTELFNRWFPNHANTVTYENFDRAYEALMRGELDMVMSSVNQLLVLTNFQEMPGFKANIVFDYPFESTFGFNKGEVILCSIFNKVLNMIDTKELAGHWTRKTYDYRERLARARFPWIIGAGALLLLVFVLSFVFIARVKSQQNERKFNEASNRFVPVQFVKMLGVDSIINLKLGASIRNVITVLFFDIRFFSVHSQMMSINQTFDFVNKVFGLAGPIIQKHNGFVDKYMGDAAMVLFENAVDAVRAGIEIYRSLILDSSTRVTNGIDGINIGIGVHTGNVMMGVIGDTEHYASTVISKHVNTASRIEGLTKQFKTAILVSSDTMQEIPDSERYFDFRFIGLVNPAGSRETIGIFEILDILPDDMRERKLKSREVFESAVRNFHTEKYQIAAERFKEVMDFDNTDECAKIFYEEAKKRTEGNERRSGIHCIFSFNTK